MSEELSPPTTETQPVSPAETAGIAACDGGLRDNPPSADEDVARLRLDLRDRSLSELEAEGLLRWDREEHIVTKGPRFDAKCSEEMVD